MIKEIVIVKYVIFVLLVIGRNNSYYFCRTNQQKAGTKIYSLTLTQCSPTVNECDERIKSHCLTRYGKKNVFCACLVRL